MLLHKDFWRLKRENCPRQASKTETYERCRMNDPRSRSLSSKTVILLAWSPISGNLCALKAIIILHIQWRMQSALRRVTAAYGSRRRPKPMKQDARTRAGSSQWTLAIYNSRKFPSLSARNVWKKGAVYVVAKQIFGRDCLNSQGS